MNAIAKKHGKFLWWVGLALSFGWAGCSDSGPSSGSLSVEWTIPIGCTQTNVVLVEARIFPADTSLPQTSTLVQSTPCSVRAPLQFANVPAGRYRVELEGFNDQQVGIFSGAIEEVRVRSGQLTATPAVTLTQKQGAIDTIWVFQNGKLCTHNNISYVQLALFDEASVQWYSTELAAPFPCDPGIEMPVESRIVGTNPDKNHKIQGILLGGLKPKFTYFVHAVAYDDEGRPQMKAERIAKTELGQVTEAMLVFVPCWSEEASNVVCQ